MALIPMFWGRSAILIYVGCKQETLVAVYCKSIERCLVLESYLLRVLDFLLDQIRPTGGVSRCARAPI